MSQKIPSTASVHNFFTLVNRNLSYLNFMSRNWANANYHSNIQTDTKYQLCENIKFGMKPPFFNIKCTFLTFETQSWDCKMIMTGKMIWICNKTGVAHFKVLMLYSDGPEICLLWILKFSTCSHHQILFQIHTTPESICTHDSKVVWSLQITNLAADPHLRPHGHRNQH